MDAFRLLTGRVIYGTVLFSVAAVALITKGLSLVLPFAPHILFAIPVTLGSLIGGLKAGLLTLLSVVLVINYFFIEPRYALTITGEDFIRLGGFGLAMLAGFLHRRKPPKPKTDPHFIKHEFNGHY
jgi:K+-sensing histidine kinase KdpD